MANNSTLIPGYWFKLQDIPCPVREHEFHETRKWRFDYAWPDAKVALEIEGGTWKKGGSRHTRGAGFRKDIEKYNTATSMGWRVLRVTPEQAISGCCADWIRETLSHGRADCPATPATNEETSSE